MICEECKKKKITKCPCGKRIRYGHFFCKKCLAANKACRDAELSFLMNMQMFNQVSNKKFKVDKNDLRGMQFSRVKE